MKYSKIPYHLVWVCAWCDDRTYPHLKKGEEYTHGICRLHKTRLLRKRKGVSQVHCMDVAASPTILIDLIIKEGEVKKHAIN